MWERAFACSVCHPAGKCLLRPAVQKGHAALCPMCLERALEKGQSCSKKCFLYLSTGECLMVALVLCVRTATSLARRGSSAQAKGQWKTLCCECTPHQFFLVLRQLWNGGDLPAVLSTPQHIFCVPQSDVAAEPWPCPFSSPGCRGS